MPKFLVLARGAGMDPRRSPEEMQKVIEKYRAWTEGIQRAGRLLYGEKLRSPEGRVVRRTGGEMMVTDGPYVESKEFLGGFWIIEASSYDEMLKLVSDSPHLEAGSLEVRQIEEMGPRS
jgi:hypothetical protein